jgi:hypothetical protein
MARHLKAADDLFDSRSSPRTESLVAAAVHWAERIMRKIDGVFPLESPALPLRCRERQSEPVPTQVSHRCGGR